MTNDLFTTQSYDSDPMVRRAVVQELGRRIDDCVDSAATIESLVGALSDPHIAVQQAAVNALLNHPPQLVSPRILPLLHGTVQHRSLAIDILQQIGTPAVSTLLQAIDDSDPHIRKSLVDILGHIACAESLKGLLHLMGDANPNVRAATAEALGHVGGAEAIAALISGLGDAEEWVLFSVIHALGELRAKQVAPLLCQYLGSPNIAIQCVAVESLGKIGDSQVLPDLLEILPLANIPLRHLLFVTIGILVGDQTDVFQRLETREFLFTRLVEALRDRELEIQLAALKGIRLMGDSAATEALLDYMRQHDSSEEAVHDALLEALTEMGDETQIMRAALDAEESVALRCIEALSSRQVTLAIPMLGQLVEHSDNREVRRAAIRALGQLKVGICEEVVVGAVNDHSGYVRSEAAKVIGQTRLRSAGPVLRTRLDEEPYSDVIVELVRALFLIHTDSEFDTFQELLSHPNVEVRSAVVSLWPDGDSEGVKKILLKHVNAPEWPVRLAIVEKLAFLEGETKLLDVFLRRLSDSHPHVRHAAVTALGSYPLESIQAGLYDTLRHDSDMWVRVRCVQLLVNLHDSGACPLFLELLPTASIPVLVEFVKALGIFQYGPALKTLEALAFNGAEEVREVASGALAQFQGDSPRVVGAE